jgi:ribosomal protein S18 acetylase RimI-like enzyme
MSGVAVRAAGGPDREWAARLLSSSEPWVTLGRGYDACLAACSSGADQLYIGWNGAVPCGMALVRERGLAGAPYLVSLAVSPGFRSAGVGAVLLRFVERVFAGRYRHLFLCVSAFNPRARRFYEREGYAAVGVLRDFIIEGADEVLMVKRLPADPGR